jgi:hypothetical protein
MRERVPQEVYEMKRRRFFISISALAAGLGLGAACGGGDDDIPTVTENADAGADVAATDAFSSPDTATEIDSGNVDDASTDGPRTLDGAACDGGAIALATIEPLFGSASAPTPITITGSGFVQTPIVYLRSAGALTPLEHVAFVDSTSLSADVPASLAVGTYEVIVQNPSGCVAISAGSYKVVANPPPRVLAVTPATGTTQNDVPVTITGCHFPTGAGATALATVDVDGVAAPQIVGAVSCAGDGGAQCDDVSPECTLTCTILRKPADGGPGLGAGAYLVRVTNEADATFGDYSVFTVTSPDGKLVGNWAPAPSLVEARRSHGAVADRIDDARRFVYALGGENAAGVPLDSVEVAPLDRYGRLGKWFVERHHLNQARSGLAVVRQGRYLYAIGGTATTNGTGGAAPSGAPLDTIERARLLDPARAPELAQATVTSASGSLTAGTYYYQVAAIEPASDPDDPNGETLPSDERVATVTATGQVSLSWQKVAGAVGYVVYRSPSATSTSHSETLLTTLGDVDTFTDDGSLPGDAGADAGSTPTTPIPIGSTGAWTVLGEKLVSARVNASAVIAPDPVGAEHLYVLGGYGDCPGLPVGSGIMDCYEMAAIDAAGDALTTGFVPGITTLQHARMRHGMDALTAANGPQNDSADGGANTSAFIVVGGGKGVQTTGETVEYALVGTAGALGVFASTTGFSLERDGTRFAIANGYAYALFGGQAPNAYKATGDLSTKIVVTSNAVSLGNWSNAGANAAQPLARYGLASDSAYFYAVGGTTNDTDALSAVTQVLR